MKKKFFFVLSIIIFYFSFLYASNSESNLTGIELCNQVYSNLKDNSFNPYTQNLVTSGENTFPYNILVDVPSKNFSDKNLILVFYQEDAIKNQKLLNNLYNYIKSSDFDFNIMMLFSYGEINSIQNKDLIYGIDCYLKTINSNEDFTAIIFDLSNPYNQIITNSNGTTAPSYLIQIFYNLFLKENLREKLPIYYLSQIYNLKIFQDRQLNSFFENSIPTIKVGFTSETEYDSIYKIISDSILLFSSTTNRTWDHHFIIANFFGRYRKLSESAIIKIIIFISFCWLVFLFLLAFINNRLKKHTWGSIKNIWFSIPITFSIIFLSFLIGRKIFSLFNFSFSDAGYIYICISFQILKSIFFVSIINLFLLLFKFDFGERAFDYLLVICSFINQSLFILVDVSLFPIFMFICFLSIIALLIKNNFIHICILILMVFPFIPYAHTVLSTSNIAELKNFIFSNKFFPLSISLVMYPAYLVLFRIFTSIRTHSNNKKNLIISMISGIMIIFAFLTILSFVRIRQINNHLPEQEKYVIKTDDSKMINLKYYDNYVFSDIIRTVDIEMNFDCELCDFRIDSQTSSPVLYTDNEYESTSPTSVYFKIPNNPPRKMTFSYGANESPCTLTVSAISKNQNENEYTVISKSISIGE